jgi:RNA polymerase primary sigma factor
MKRTQTFEKLDEIDAYFEDIKKYRPLSSREEKELAVKIRKGDKAALDKLVNANLKFVVNYAKQYRKSGVPFSDLISEGNIGLIKAAEKFDETKGVKFISYAVWWIRNSIQECINRYLGNVEEVNAETYVFDNCKKAEYDYSSKMVNEEFEEELTNLQSREATIAELMKTLKKREIRILSLYFGLYDGKEMTLDEIGQEMDLTKERVRQIKDKALVKLKVNALSSDEFDTFKELR